MKIKFTNSKVSTTYQDKEYYVEGVGESITLTDVELLTTPGSYSTEVTIGYDEHVFDSRPYAYGRESKTCSSYPIVTSVE